MAQICLCQFMPTALPTRKLPVLRYLPSLTAGASSAMAKYLSERENRADEVAGKKATDKDHLLQQVLFDLVQTDTIKKQPDARLAYSEKIKPVHKLHSRNTEQAAFVVLKSPSVPSVLVETSFSPIREEERLLGTAAFRQKIATAIARRRDQLFSLV
ncbi:N-acetylmuramoyl-L-alanine amidase [Escherichia coli]|uniref:N-acetylmuramoyl-L-alanine amidase n=1 Tax=Escherichia coli TaxID=562 RepID=A0A376SAN8_ECOLX|nr:N-acetylmuramoyl-L-alanine amidase [Escherichia coli]